MTALNSGRNTTMRLGDHRVEPMAAAVKVFMGAIVMRNAAGHLPSGLWGCGTGHCGGANGPRRTEYVRLIGQDKAKALAAVADRLPLRVPLAKKWLANMLRWQGHSNAQIARTLRVSEVSVRRWYNGHGEP